VGVAGHCVEFIERQARCKTAAASMRARRLAVAKETVRNQESIASAAGEPTIISDAAVVLAVLAALLWPALWNGYPLVYHDTEDYVNMSFTFDLVTWRIMPYALVMALGRLFGSLWPVIVLHAALATWLLHEAASAFVPRYRRLALLGTAALLAAGTCLPWINATLMPDALTALVPLAIATLAFGQLPRWRRLLLAIPLSVAVACHLSHLVLAIGLLLALGAWRLVAQFRRGALRPALAVPLYAVLLGTLAVPAVHKLATGEAFLTRGGRVLQLALFVQNGLAQRYLDKVCPQGAALKLCAYRDQLPATADAFLWAHWASPFWKLGGWTGMREDARKIVIGTIRTFPGEIALSSLRNTVRQLGEMRLGDGLDPKRRANWPGEYYDTARARYPQEFPAYIGARQQQGKGIDFATLNAMQQPLAWAGLVLLALLLIEAARRRDAAGVGLAAVALLAILGNAVVCGAFSNPHDRYQNRIVWLAVAADALLLARLQAARGWRIVPQPAPTLPQPGGLATAPALAPLRPRGAPGIGSLPGQE
jgi:hypothetical protein